MSETGIEMVRSASPLDGARTYTPGSVAELRTALATAPEATLIPMGGGTLIGRGGITAAPFACIDLRAALGGAADHQADDLTVVAPAGMTIDALNAQLAAAGQWVPLDPPLPSVATIGGTLAAGINGPLRSRFGLARDLVLGLTVMRADGVLVKAGGRVVKNVTGYDLMRLWCGSHGTLGIITEVALRALPRSAAVTLVTHYKSIEDVVAAARRMSTDDIRPEFADALSQDGGWTMIVRVAESAVSATRAALAAAAEPTPDDALYRESRDFGTGESSAFVMSASTTLGHVAGLASAVMKMKPDGCVVRPLAGVVRAGWGQEGLPSREVLKAGVDGLRHLVGGVQGSVIVDRMPVDYHETIDTWGAAPSSFEVMRRVKAAYDPENRLSHGRFIGGI